ncbi:Grixazone synthase [Rhypophila decipiens]
MKFIALIVFILSLLSLLDAHPAGGHDPELIAAKRVKELHRKYVKTVEGILKHQKTGCTLKTVRRRKEWNSLTKREKLDYINSVHCLAKLPYQTPLSLVPGVRNRYDDFTASHALRTPFVHQNGIFLAYHRHYNHLFETALRTECNFKGTLPYWDWTLGWQDVNKNPIFDGSPTSLGSNGVFIPNRTHFISVNPLGKVLDRSPGTGGGCVYTGPFTPDKWIVHLGPFTDPKGPNGGWGYNPRCLDRDLLKDFGTYTRPSNITHVLDDCQDLACASPYIQESGNGVHSAGHIQTGGIMLDVFASPSDPVFWPHHAMVDKIWTMWQFIGGADEYEGRTREVWGTATRYNIPPSPNVTLDSPVDVGGIIGPTRRLGELVSTIDNDYCYIYE